MPPGSRTSRPRLRSVSNAVFSPVRNFAIDDTTVRLNMFLASRRWAAESFAAGSRQWSPSRLRMPLRIRSAPGPPPFM